MHLLSRRVCLPEDTDSNHRDAGDEDPAKPIACLLRDGQAAPPGYGLYLVAGNEAGMRLGTSRVAGTPGPEAPAIPGPVLSLGPELMHLDAGDIIHIPDDGRRVTVLWKNSARHNGLLLTEQCDNYCLMCSQPPRTATIPAVFDLLAAANGSNSHASHSQSLRKASRVASDGPSVFDLAGVAFLDCVGLRA